MLDLLMEFIESDDRAAEYRGLDWSHEYDLAINGDPNDTQTMLRRRETGNGHLTDFVLPYLLHKDAPFPYSVISAAIRSIQV